MPVPCRLIFDRLHHTVTQSRLEIFDAIECDIRATHFACAAPAISSISLKPSRARHADAARHTYVGRAVILRTMLFSFRETIGIARHLSPTEHLPALNKFQASRLTPKC